MEKLLEISASLVGSDDNWYWNKSFSLFANWPSRVNRSESPFISAVVVRKRHKTAASSSTKNRPPNDPVLCLLSTRLIFSFGSMPLVYVSLYPALSAISIKLAILTIALVIAHYHFLLYLLCVWVHQITLFPLPLIWYLFISRGYQV